jgi:hypothetical protein
MLPTVPTNEPVVGFATRVIFAKGGIHKATLAS